MHNPKVNAPLFGLIILALFALAYALLIGSEGDVLEDTYKMTPETINNIHDVNDQLRDEGIEPKEI
ncbi:MAG: hypothetical protein AAB573_03430 [Patescibacteria group bacterium]